MSAVDLACCQEPQLTPASHRRNYLRTILQPFILAVCEGHPSRFENESRSSSSSDSPNSRSIEILAQTCFDRICDSIDEAPPCVASLRLAPAFGS